MMAALLRHPYHLTALTLIVLATAILLARLSPWAVVPGLLIAPVGVSLGRQAFNDGRYPSDPEP